MTRMTTKADQLPRNLRLRRHALHLGSYPAEARLRYKTIATTPQDDWPRLLDELPSKTLTLFQEMAGRCRDIWFSPAISAAWQRRASGEIPRDGRRA